jgi:hypothetical protein
MFSRNSKVRFEFDGKINLVGDIVCVNADSSNVVDYKVDL